MHYITHHTYAHDTTHTPTNTHFFASTGEQDGEGEGEYEDDEEYDDEDEEDFFGGSPPSGLSACLSVCLCADAYFRCTQTKICLHKHTSRLCTARHNQCTRRGRRRGWSYGPHTCLDCSRRLSVQSYMHAQAHTLSIASMYALQELLRGY